MLLHHVGYVVRDLERFASSMPGLELVTQVEDPLQNARLALYSVGGPTHVELIQPLSAKAFTWGHLERMGEGPHHICFQGVRIDELDDIMRKHRLMKIRGPMHAVLFDRDVVFAISRQKAVVEFLL